MKRTRFLLALGVLVALGCRGGLASAAGSSPYRLHVQGHLGCGLKMVDIDVPWDSEASGSPLDFAAEAGDRIDLERLRWAWAVLRKSREGEPVTFATSSERIRAWRRDGYLVIEPRHLDDRDDHDTRIRIPDYIVDTILNHDGRLTDRDLERLTRDRGKITLVKIDSDAGGASVWMTRNDERSD